MKRLQFCLKELRILLLICAAVAQSTFAQWKTTLPTLTQYTAANMIAKGDTLYTSATPAQGFSGSSWIVQSNDGGILWSACKNGLPLTFGSVISLTADASHIYAALSDSGFYRSSDGGRNWEIINSGLTSLSGKIRFMVTDGSRLYCALQRTGGDSLFASTDAGSSWAVVSTTGLPASPSMTLFATFNGALYMVVSSGVYKSTDNGISWTGVNAGLPTYPNKTAVSELFGDSSDLFIQINQGNLYKLSGSTWQSVYTNSTQVASASTGNSLLITSTTGLQRSTDGGSTWDAVLKYSSAGSTTNIFSGGKWAIVRTDSGVFASSDEGATWLKRNDNKLLGFTAAVSHNGKLFVTPPYGGKMYISLDSGITWQTSTSLYKKFKDDAAAYLYKDDTLFVGGGSSYYSVDNGTTWTQISTSQLSAKQLFLDGDDIYASTAGGVYVLSSSRNFWTMAGTGISQSVLCMGADPYYLFAATGSKVYRLARGTTSWTAAMTGIPATTIVGFSQIGSTIALGTGSGIYLSTDAGTSWKPANGLPSGAFVAVNSVTTVGSSVFVSIYQTKALDNTILNEGGIFRSDDNGQTWHDAGDGLPKMPLASRFIAFDGNLYSTGNDFVGWVRPLSELVTAVHHYSGNVPASFDLHQNFPNPFNPSTKIEYQISNQEFVTLKVYDIVGREVATLINEQVSPGTYEVNFDGGKLSSGVYFYQLRAGSSVETKQMMLIK